MSTTLIVPGLGNSSADHWQSWWQALDPQAIRVNQDDWQAPHLSAWAHRVAESIDAATAPVWLVAHSFGCLAAIAATLEREEVVAGMFLVAPADPDRFHLRDALPGAPLGVPSVLIASSDDPWLGMLKAGLWAQRWGSRLISIGAAGHINAESGFGPWIDGHKMFREFVRADGGLPLGRIGETTARH